MQRVLYGLVLLLLAAPNVAAGQAARRQAPCPSTNDQMSGVKRIAAFTLFDTELRAAVKSEDATALAFLVDFPLRVNTSRGAILIPDAASLGGHFQEIFPLQVRNDILQTKVDDYICKYDQGTAYRAGVIWLAEDDHRFAISVVNVAGPVEKPSAPKLLYTCTTSTHRISVEELVNGSLRFRSWNKSTLLSAVPDITLAKGKATFEGTGVCAYPVYTFSVGNTVYEVDGAVGCTDGKEPQKATGHLSVTIADKQATDSWCF